MKTLDQVEPRILINSTNTPGDADSVFKITQPGSYYLGQNLTGVAGKSGIEVTASNVTIDLNGFLMLGVAGSLAGIDLNNGGAGGLTGITIKEGSLRGWASDGIKGDLSAFDRFVNLHINSITGSGIKVNSGTVIDHCIISNCTGSGITTSNDVIIQNTVASVNAGNGIAAGTNSTITNCEAETNSGGGIVVVGGRGTVSNCNATLNAGTGIGAGDGGQLGGAVAVST
jgi:hypothetical protein